MMVRRPRAILFDLDDTIITEGERHPILAKVASEFALSIGPLAPAELADRLEQDLTNFWADPERARAARVDPKGISTARETIIRDTLSALGISEAPELAHAFSNRFSELRALGAREFEGARSTIEALRAMKIRLALVTNGGAEIQRAKLERFSLATLFDHVQIEGEHGFGKPEERAYLHAIEVLGVMAAETWMVGDNLEWEVAAPQRLGIHAVWHDHLGKGLPRGSVVRPNRIITRLPELLLLPED